MIQAVQLTKKFEEQLALDSFDAVIEDGHIYGLVGSNGAGKSTLLRLIAGIYQPTSGEIQIDGQSIYENQSLKQSICFVSDELFFPAGATLDSLAKLFAQLYESWDSDRYQKLLQQFPLNPKKKLSTCSKGMKRQASLIAALSCNPKYLLLDEAFDGLDPVIRVALRKLLADDVAQRGMTVLIASHNLRELEDVCDQVGVMHQGKILFQQDLMDLTLGFCKIQAAFQPQIAKERLQAEVDLLQYETNGSMVYLIARGEANQVKQKIEALHPIFCESIPLTLEEVFIYEMEAVGYDYNHVIF